MNLLPIKKEIERLIELSGDTDWKEAKIVFDFPPFINRGIKMQQFVLDENGKSIRLIRMDENLRIVVEKLIFDFNQDYQYNQIVFQAVNGELEKSTIAIQFNEDVDLAFRANIPKSYKGSMLPWWKNPEETKELE